MRIKTLLAIAAISVFLSSCALGKWHKETRHERNARMYPGKESQRGHTNGCKILKTLK